MSKSNISIVAHTLSGWAVRTGDCVTRTTGALCTVLKKEGNLILVSQFIPGSRTYVGRVMGRTITCKVHPSELRLRPTPNVIEL